MTYFTFAEHCGLTDDEREAVLCSAAQKRVQLCQLAAFALVAHPEPAPADSSGAGDGRGRRCRSVALPYLLVQRFDPLPGQPQQRLVFRHHLGVRVPEVGQQAEVQILIAIGQEPNFQRLDQILDVLQRW